MTTTATQPTTRPGRRTGVLVRHYLEMVVAMFVGMIALGSLRDLVGLDVVFAERPGASYALMATDMAIGMAAWMRFRGHGWGCTLEMCAAMYVPLLLLPLVWGGVMGAMTFMVVSHVLMMVAMLAVVLRRADEIAHH